LTRLFIVRHGPTHHKGLVGHSDIPADLSDTDAITWLSDRLPQDAVMISSDLQRTVKTADAIQGARTRLPHNPDLRENAFGTWELRRFDDVAAEDPELSMEFWTEPGDAAPPNGESWNQFCARVNTGIDNVIAEHAGKDIIIVAHFGVILTQIQRASNMSAKSVFSFVIDNLSITQIDHLGEDTWRIKGINHKL
jgi:broad specificity phosphatase PhoE